MTMESAGETEMMPLEIVSYCISLSPTVSLEATLNLLANHTQLPSDIPNARNADPVIR